MIEICITICIVVALVCITVCYVYKQQMYNGTDLSEQQLIEDIRTTAIMEHNRNQELIESNNDIDEDGTLYVAAKNTLSTLRLIIELTDDYKKENNKDERLSLF